jgi:membrane fusion protein, multidrug efflux system
MATRIVAWTLLAASGLGSPALAADDPPSVLVRAQAPQRARLTETLVGYGVVAPETSRVSAVSVPRGGLIATLRVSVGQVVRQSDPLLELQTDPTANQDYQQAVNEVEYARGEFDRAQSLAEQQLVNQTQVAAAKKALADAQAHLAAQAKLGTESLAETLRAPFDGVVISIAVAQGERIAAGAPLLRLAATDRLRAELGVEPADASRVKAGMPVRVVSVFDERKSIETTVAQVQGVINPQTQLVDVVASFSNTGRMKLLPGTRVRGLIGVDSATTWVVPRQAVLRDDRGAYLFQIRDGRARRVDVVAGITSDEQMGVDGPIDPAEKIVVLGNYELSDGMQVREAKQ